MIGAELLFVGLINISITAGKSPSAGFKATVNKVSEILTGYVDGCKNAPDKAADVDGVPNAINQNPDDNDINPDAVFSAILQLHTAGGIAANESQLISKFKKKTTAKATIGDGEECKKGKARLAAVVKNVSTVLAYVKDLNMISAVMRNRVIGGLRDRLAIDMRVVTQEPSAFWLETKAADASRRAIEYYSAIRNSTPANLICIGAGELAYYTKIYRNESLNALFRQMK